MQNHVDPANHSQKFNLKRVSSFGSVTILMCLALESRLTLYGGDMGSGAFLTPGSGMGKKSRSGSGIRWLEKQVALKY